MLKYPEYAIVTVDDDFVKIYSKDYMIVILNIQTYFQKEEEI